MTQIERPHRRATMGEPLDKHPGLGQVDFLQPSSWCAGLVGVWCNVVWRFVDCVDAGTVSS